MKETVEHLILECPKYKKQREKLKRRVGGLGKMRLNVLLGDKRVVGLTMEYVAETKRFQTEQEGNNTRERR
jgi:hypothetical protein